MNHPAFFQDPRGFSSFSRAADPGRLYITLGLGLDWADPNLLRQLLKMRIVANGVEGDPPFQDLWNEICVPHMKGQESSGYMIDRCLMRPRNLLDFLNYCRSHAVNLGHTTIQSDDIERGEQFYSTELVTNIGLEIRDVYPDAGDILYEFAGQRPNLHSTDLRTLLAKSGIDLAHQDRLVDLLLWYGFLGLAKSMGEAKFIFDMRYDMKLLKALIKRIPEGELVYYINPAFWSGLEIDYNT